MGGRHEFRCPFVSKPEACPRTVVVAVFGWLSVRMLPRYRLIPGVAINVLGGIVVLYVFGIAGMVLRTDLTVWAAVVANGTFLPGDLLKAVVASAVATQVHRAYPALLAEIGPPPSTRVRPATRQPA